MGGKGRLTSTPPLPQPFSPKTQDPSPTPPPCLRPTHCGILEREQPRGRLALAFQSEVRARGKQEEAGGLCWSRGSGLLHMRQGGDTQTKAGAGQLPRAPAWQGLQLLSEAHTSGGAGPCGAADPRSRQGSALRDRTERKWRRSALSTWGAFVASFPVGLRTARAGEAVGRAVFWWPPFLLQAERLEGPLWAGPQAVDLCTPARSCQQPPMPRAATSVPCSESYIPTSWIYHRAIYGGWGWGGLVQYSTFLI